MTTCILVTGANQGLGHCVVQQLLVQGRSLQIYAACRDLAKAQKNVQELCKTPSAHSSNILSPAVIDLADDTTIEKAARSISRLDILVNNAGIYVEADFSSPASIRKALLETYNTNTFGTIALSTAFLPKLQEAASRDRADSMTALINVSTGLSSFANKTNPNSPQYNNDEVVYASSKAALNYYTVWAARKYPDVRIGESTLPSSCAIAALLTGAALVLVAVAPGHSSTSLNNYTGRQTAEAGAQYITDAILDSKGPTGAFLEKGKVHDW